MKVFKIKKKVIALAFVGAVILAALIIAYRKYHHNDFVSELSTVDANVINVIERAKGKSESVNEETNENVSRDKLKNSKIQDRVNAVIEGTKKEFDNINSVISNNISVDKLKLSKNDLQDKVNIADKKTKIIPDKKSRNDDMDIIDIIDKRFEALRILKED